MQIIIEVHKRRKEKDKHSNNKNTRIALMKYKILL